MCSRVIDVVILLTNMAAATKKRKTTTSANIRWLEPSGARIISPGYCARDQCSAKA